MSKKLIVANERQGISTLTTIPKDPALVNDICDISHNPIIAKASRHAFFIANTLEMLFQALPDDQQGDPLSTKSMAGDLGEMAKQLGLALGGFGGTLIDGTTVEGW